MAKVPIHFRINYIIIWGLFTILASCTTNITDTKCYYRYSIGQIHIKNPVGITIVNNYNGKTTNYVCPDTAMIHWRDFDWQDRKDVYQMEFATQFYRDNMPDHFEGIKYIGPYENCYTNPMHRLPRVFDRLSHFNPMYTFQEFHDSVKNIDVWFNKFYFDIDLFDAYMQAVDGYFYDPTDPYFQNPEADCWDAFAFSNHYMITVCPHFSLIQILKLNISNKKRMGK